MDSKQTIDNNYKLIEDIPSADNENTEESISLDLDLEPEPEMPVETNPFTEKINIIMRKATEVVDKLKQKFPFLSVAVVLNRFRKKKSVANENGDIATDEAKQLIEDLLKNKKKKTLSELIKENLPISHIEWDEKKIGIAVFFLLLPIVVSGVYFGVERALYIEKLPASKHLEASKIEITVENLLDFAEKGNLRVVKWLLEAGIDPSSRRGFDGKTALMQAAAYGHNDIVTLLIEHGANLDTQDIYGQTALIKATEMGKTEAVKLLLHAGAIMNLKDNSSNTAMSIAKAKGFSSIVDALIKTEKERAPVILSSPGTTKKRVVQKGNNNQKTNDENNKSPKTKPQETIMKVNVMPIAGGNGIIKGSVGNISLGMNAADVINNNNASPSEDIVNGKTVPSINIQSENGNTAIVVDLFSEVNKFVTRINIYDPRYKTNRNIGVGSTVKEVIAAHNAKALVEADNSLYIFVDDLNALLELNMDEYSGDISWLMSGDLSAVPQEIRIKKIILR